MIGNAGLIQPNGSWKRLYLLIILELNNQGINKIPDSEIIESSGAIKKIQLFISILFHVQKNERDDTERVYQFTGIKLNFLNLNYFNIYSPEIDFILLHNLEDNL